MKPVYRVMQVNVGGNWCDAMVLGDGIEISLIIPLIQVPKEAIRWEVVENTEERTK